MTAVTSAPASIGEIRPASPVITQLIFIGRSFRHSIRDPEALIMAVIMPVLMMMLFTVVFGGAIEKDGQYINYVVPGVILLCAGFGAASTAVAVSRDMTNGVVRRFRTMPVRSAMVIGGHVAASLARNLLATTVVIGVALLIGWRPSAGPVRWLAAVGLITLYILAITSLFAALGLLASSPETASNLGFAILFLPYVSSAFVPVATMPNWLQWVAGHQPITPVIETLRSSLTGTPLGSHGWYALGWSLLILLGSCIWVAWLFPRRRAA